MSAEKVVSVACADIGYTESPPNTNKTKYGEEYGLNGAPWCVIAVWYWFKHAGEETAFFGGAKTASCGTLYRWYKANGWTVDPKDAKPGDIVILNFHGTDDTEHCGLVIDYPHDGVIRTIEGNTCLYSGGSQDNGGIVATKSRSFYYIVGVCRPQFKPEPKKDYIGHWAEANIEKVKKSGLMVGDPDGNFRPDAPVTRGELATVLSRLEDILK